MEENSEKNSRIERVYVLGKFSSVTTYQHKYSPAEVPEESFLERTLLFPLRALLGSVF